MLSKKSLFYRPDGINDFGKSGRYFSDQHAYKDRNNSYPWNGRRAQFLFGKRTRKKL